MSKKQATDDGEKTGLVKARVLAAGLYGQPNDVIEITAAEAESGTAGGEIDASAEAVAYAESLKTPAA